ncbi:hypothetical protein SAMN05421505_1852 [Sinosporangium album]|uniref:Uncharacterized protein n=1 Tax=Sinosporangium album TaxID=504805 RepID=A0A1G8LW15_9ACTN|nr:hypothetical protein SAMN05421505_1852 [Sinosporangium album]
MSQGFAGLRTEQGRVLSWGLAFKFDSFPSWLIAGLT